MNYVNFVSLLTLLACWKKKLWKFEKWSFLEVMTRAIVKFSDEMLRILHISKGKMLAFVKLNKPSPAAGSLKKLKPSPAQPLWLFSRIFFGQMLAPKRWTRNSYEQSLKFEHSWKTAFSKISFAKIRLENFRVWLFNSI